MFLGSSQIYYYLGTGLLFTAGSAVVYNGWDYYAPRQNNKIICLAHINTNLLALLWLIQGISMLACCVSYSVFTSYDSKSKKKTLLVTYSALFLKLCPKVVKLLHLFNFCQLFAIIFDLLILPECNSYKLRYLFVIALTINWLVAIWGLMLRKRILLPPFVYDPATYKKGYLTSLRVCLVPFNIFRISSNPWAYDTLIYYSKYFSYYSTNCATVNKTNST